ncbi:hypothetical protein Ahy_B09g095802 isoform F [Arachis hypogaea]|uniref:Uncharacterized protein n=1 Tax=Arachis hypogaea TaxID=3818 RepID=A0A444XGH4_ARAHY|nr:hypothetical protein Ahy_B09g095802 isoform F [Arachis hypogaea]
MMSLLASEARTSDEVSLVIWLTRFLERKLTAL